MAQQTSRAGASRGRSRGGLALYIQRHLQTLVGSLGRLWRQPFASLMIVLVIGVALAMPALLQMLVQNARAATGSWDNAVDLSVYLDNGVADEAAAELAERLRARDDIASVRVIGANEALEDFRRNSGFGEALDALDENPLPVTLIVQPANPRSESAQLASLAADLTEEAQVALVQVDTEWVKRFHAMLEVVRRAALLAGVLLAVAVLVIVGNTIRMEIQHRRDEIEIVKLIGASDGFIRRPFLYSGLWYGLAGGLAAALLVAGVTRLLAEPVAGLAGLYGSEFRLIGLGGEQSAVLLLAGGILGWTGSWIAATRHMRRIEPG